MTTNLTQKEASTLRYFAMTIFVKTSPYFPQENTKKERESLIKKRFLREEGRGLFSITIDGISNLSRYDRELISQHMISILNQMGPEEISEKTLLENTSKEEIQALVDSGILIPHRITTLHQKIPVVTYTKTTSYEQYEKAKNWQKLNRSNRQEYKKETKQRLNMGQ